MNARPPATLTLVILSVVVYLGAHLLGQENVMRLLMISEYLNPALPEIRSGQVWRLVTPVFLHFGLFHIVFNMLWIWELGRLIEAQQGSVTVVVITTVIAVASNVAQYLVSGPVFGGMSGVLYGFFGYVWIQGLINPAFAVRLNPPVVYLLLGWFVLCWSTLLERLFGLHVANTAHTAGLVAGILLAVLATALGRMKRRQGRPGGH